ncbi:LOW QUALITY PROTEIN: Hypothetical protein PHPALM_1626 [Phytophthora palmivora]|uniref:Uncharacterized protein n=1 Tax=Phytophthora palmivora TaxID=4796 RepID=A0A2P4YRZ3_9STRA|nr:LOW QUALITY PROTEIN: Hypothetical protein PHPALM_1626 [Phytophthora palmivora]
MPKRRADDIETSSDEEEPFQHSIPAPIFAPILPPKLRSISHEALVKWDRRRREYESKMRARCRSTGEAYNLVTQNVKESFDAELLESFVHYGCEVADVTEGQIIAEIKALLAKVKNNDMPDIKLLFKQELKMDMKETDIDARILSYFQRFKQVVKENGLDEVFAGVDGEKEKCKRLISCLAPAVLKTDVKTAVRWTNKDAAKSILNLYTLVYNKAVEHERHFQKNKRMRNIGKEQGKSGNKPGSSKPDTVSGKGAAHPKKAATEKKESSQPKADKKTDKLVDKKAGKKLSKPREPPSPCPKCHEMHWLNDCPEATDVEKMLWKKLREGNKVRKSRVKRLMKLMPSASRTMTINGVLELPCCPDTGSDYSMISQSHWAMLLAADPSVQQIPLDSPVDIVTFGAHPVAAKTKAMLHVLIHTAAGPVQIAEAVPCLITDTDDDEFIIGRDLLGALGIDVERQLELLAVHSEDKTSGDPFDLEAVCRSSVTNNLSSPRALEHGFPPDKVDKLRGIVHAYDVWRLELRDDPPARVPPLEVRLKEGATPCKCKPRIFDNFYLVDLGLVFENPTSRWASPVLPVKKSQELMDLRQTTDYREVNLQSKCRPTLTSHCRLAMKNARGKQHFGLFDFIKGFWQLPLAEFCQEWLSYMTNEKIFTPRRVPQGCANAAIHFQKTMEKCFAKLLYKYLLVWIDDILLYAEDIDTYLDKLAEFFVLLNEFGLKLSVKKSSLYQKEVKWCGKIIDASGVRHDPARIESLSALPYPSTAGELQQYICAINWMRESLVDYARQVAPLQRKLDESLARTRRTKRAAAGISIELDTAEKAAFDNVKDMLASAVTLSFPDDTATTCLLTDASDVGWAVIVTQVDNFDIKIPIQDQQHRLLECMSGTFTGSQLNWTVIEKEAFPIAFACDKLDYLLLRPQGFRMFCDHRNLIHVFAPDESVKKHVKGKLLRWSMKLMNFNYIIEHIAGPNNVWADMVSRWAGNHVPIVTTTKRLRDDAAQRELVVEAVHPSTPPLRPLDDENLVWPTLEEISTTQSRYEPPAGTERTTDGILKLNNRIWIPVEANDLLQRLFVIAHCGAQGHRGGAAMVEHLRRLFVIEHLQVLVLTFVHQCRLCLYSKGGETIPRPWGETIECSERNGVIHFDYLYMGESFGYCRYLRPLKNTADSTVTVEALLAWHSRFGVPPTWISDQGSHFKNEVVSELSRRLRTQQEFTPAYCPWINGSVERVNRDILQVIRTMILEYKIHYKD